MARLQESFLERIEAFCDRIVRVADALDERGVSRRMVDQVLAAGTSVGANVFEADEAMSRADFVKCMCIATKELNETRFWLRLACRHEWITPSRMLPVVAEAVEIKKILGTMIARTKRKPSRE